MKKISVFLLSLMLFAVSGCAQKKLSREEQLAIQERNSSAAVQIYEGFTVDQLANAADKVLYLIDPGDMIIEHKTNKIIAHRKHFTFFAT